MAVTLRNGTPMCVGSVPARRARREPDSDKSPLLAGSPPDVEAEREHEHAKHQHEWHDVFHGLRHPLEGADLDQRKARRHAGLSLLWLTGVGHGVSLRFG